MIDPKTIDFILAHPTNEHLKFGDQSPEQLQRLNFLAEMLQDFAKPPSVVRSIKAVKILVQESSEMGIDFSDRINKELDNLREKYAIHGLELKPTSDANGRHTVFIEFYHLINR